MPLPIDLKSTAYRINTVPYVSTQDLWLIVDDLEAIKATAGSPVAGVDSINSLNAAAQTLAPVDDTNVTLSINSAISTHTFTLGWTGSLAATRGGTGLSAYTTGDLLYASAANTLSALPIGSNGDILTIVAGVPSWAPSVPDGITSLNAQTGATQTFATGTAGTDFAISSALDVHTFDIPSSSALNRGLLLAADWTTFNNKFDLPALTAGSVLFSNGTTIAQDNANFFYDDTNNRLGLGTTSPSARLHVVGTGATSATSSLIVENSTSSNLLSIQDNGQVRIGSSSDPTAMLVITPSGSLTTGIYIPTVIGSGQGINIATSSASAISAYFSNSGTGGLGLQVASGYSHLNGNVGINSSVVATQSLTIGTPNTNDAAIYITNASTGFSTIYGIDVVMTDVLGSATKYGAYFNVVDGLINRAIHVQNGDITLASTAGSVGFGTTSPSARLHVVGTGATSATYGFKIFDSSSNLNFSVRDDGGISMENIQTGNAGLASGDLYKDSAANILANGDYVVGMKV